MVQKCALKSLENNTSFYDSLIKDKAIMKNISVNITEFNYKTFMMFAGISFVCAATFIVNQLSDINLILIEANIIISK